MLNRNLLAFRMGRQGNLDLAASGKPVRVLHLSSVFATLGGIQNILQDHYARDRDNGLEPKFIVLMEPPSPGWPGVQFLDWSFEVRIGKARRQLAAALKQAQPFDICVLHTEWGWPFFLDLLGDVRRIAYIHSDIPQLGDWLPSRSRAVDGAIVVSDTLGRRFRAAYPEFPNERILKSNYPIDPPESAGARREPKSPGAPWVLGYCGRLSVTQKRVDRFPQLVRRLSDQGVNFQLEFLGEGDQRNQLETAFPDRNRFVFHGRRPRNQIWELFNRWDFILFTSDFEGTPIALLEALAAGVLPIHPKIGSGGDDYAAAIHPNLVYKAGDVGAMEESIRWAVAQPPEEWNRLRARAVELVGPHHGSISRAAIAHFIKRIEGAPPLPKVPMQKGPFFIGWMTFTQTIPLMKWTRRFRR